MLGGKSCALSLSDDQLAAASPWALRLGWRCSSHFLKVLCTYKLPQPQDLLLVPAQRNQV